MDIEKLEVNVPQNYKNEAENNRDKVLNSVGPTNENPLKVLYGSAFIALCWSRKWIPSTILSFFFGFPKRMAVKALD